MAFCARCGKETSLMDRVLSGRLCPICAKQEAIEIAEKKRAEMAEIKKRELAEMQEQERKRVAESQKREAQIKDQVEQIRSSVLTRLNRGDPVYICDSVYLPVDSLLLEELLNPTFDLSSLRSLALRGWEAISVIPRTAGIGLQNVSSPSPVAYNKVWAGGVGGNVIGVHIIIKKSITISEAQETQGEFVDYVRKHLL